MSDEAAIAKGARAERELNETREAFEAVRTAIIEELITTSPTNSDKVLKLHLAVQNLSAVEKALINVVQTGQIAKFALSQAGLTQP